MNLYNGIVNIFKYFSWCVSSFNVPVVFKIAKKSILQKVSLLKMHVGRQYMTNLQAKLSVDPLQPVSHNNPNQQ